MHVFCFGLGYVAARLARQLSQAGWRVSGTTRDAAKAARLGDVGIAAYLFADGVLVPEGRAALADATHVLASIPPADDSDDPDPGLHVLRDVRGGRPLAWAGYLSTTGVYGDAGGAWVDETTPTAPINARSARRVAAERVWSRYAEASGTPLDILRLAGIYGPGRSALDQLRAGTARRIVKPGHEFSRIHADDILLALCACMAAPAGVRTYNVCDDEPAPQPDVVAFAAALLGIEPPPEQDFETAQMSAAARAFYAGNRRVSSALIKSEHRLQWRYSNYRDGLQALALQDRDRQ